MGKTAVVFPGQGSQYVGMGKDLCASHPVARSTMDEADDVLRFSLSRLCFEGPDDELVRTENTQPALLAVSVAIFRVLKSEGFEPQGAAGHSLGEYSALVAAGAVEFSDALRTVRLRGQLMEDAVPKGSGTMGAIIGLEDDAVRALCEEEEGVVSPATYNAPGQVVVAGETGAVLRVMEAARKKGARRTQQLNVSGPFHSSLLALAGEELGRRLDAVPVRLPDFPVYANVSAKPVADADQVRRNLAEQVSSPVRWVETVENMAADGYDTFVEAGPGRVLSGLIKRINRSATLFNVESPETLQAWKEARNAE